MIPYAARSFTDPAGFMNSAFPRISQPVSSDRRRSRINGVFPTYPSMPWYVAVMQFESLLELLSHFSLFDSEFFDRDWADRYVFVFYPVNRFKVGSPQMAAIEVGEVTAAVGVGECNSNSNEGSPKNRLLFRFLPRRAFR